MANPTAVRLVVRECAVVRASIDHPVAPVRKHDDETSTVGSLAVLTHPMCVPHRAGRGGTKEARALAIAAVKALLVVHLPVIALRKRVSARAVPRPETTIARVGARLSGGRRRIENDGVDGDEIVVDSARDRASIIAARVSTQLDRVPVRRRQKEAVCFWVSHGTPPSTGGGFVAVGAAGRIDTTPHTRVITLRKPL